MKFDNTSAAPSGGFTFGGGHSSHFSATSSNVKKSTNHNGFGSTTNGFSFGTTSSNVKPSTSTSSYQGDYQGESPCSYTPFGVTPGKCTFSFTPITPSGKFKSAIQKLDSVGNKTKNNAPLAFGSTPSLESGKSSFTTNMFSIVGKKSDNDFKLKYQQPWYCQTCGTMNNFDVYTCSNTSCCSKNILKKKQLQGISKIQSRFRFRKKFGLMNATMKRKTFQDWHSFSKKSKSRNKICKQLKKESQTSSKPLFVTMLNMLKEKASVNLVNTDIERYCFLDILLEEMVKRKDNMLNARCVILDDVPPIKEVTEFLYLLLVCEKIHVNLRSQSFLLILKWLTCHDFNHKNILQNIVAYFGISGSSTFLQFYTKNGTDTTAKKNENKTKPFVRHEIKSSGGFQFDPNLSFNNNIFNIAKEDQAEYLKGVFKKDTKGDPKQKKHASKLGKGKNIFASLGIKTKKDLEAEKKNITNASSASRACKEKNIFASLEIKTKKEITNNVLNDKSHGVGKTLFMELATEFLHAYNILPSNTFIKSSAPNLYNAAAENRNDTFASICKNVEGGIMVSQAELILPTNAVNESNYVTSAKTGLVESLVQEASKPSSFIALACKPNKAISIKNSHAEIETKFPWHVRIPNPSPETLVKIAEQYVQQRNSALQEGLQDKLAQHLHDTCGKVPEGGVRFIRNLVDQAIRSRVERISKDETQLNTNNILIPADFGIGKELGDPELIAEVMKEVEGLIGMDSAKQWLKKISKSIKFVNITGDRRSVKRCYNLKLTGCPGTGKTTFARIIHKFFKAHGILTGEFVEKNALELKGEYVGSTAPLVKAAFKDAKFGTLFIDEAYALASENGKGGDTFSKEAIRTMLTEIENNRDNTLVIIAGYQDKIERLLREDPGLPRRFPEALHLVNYSTNEIAQIAEYVAFSRNGKSFEPGLVEALSKHIGIKYRRKIASENGGLAVNLVQKAVQALEGRLLESSEGQTRNPTELMNDAKTICGIDFGIEDLGKGSIGADQLKKDEIAAKVENLIGMANMKEFFAKMKNTALYVEKTGNTAPLFNSMNLVLMGNPGTGKSTTARLIGEFLFAHGILETGHFKEINALHLKGQYVGQTAHNVREIVQDALGGCLFIDEAYALISNGGDTFGKEVIQTLLTEIENHRSELLVILAGYEGPMGKLLMADPGLKRRFRQQVILKNYNGTELAEIAEAKAEEKDYIFAPGLKEKLAKWIPFKWSEEMASHNGGLAVNLVETAMENLAERTMKNWDKLNLNIEDKMTQVYVKTFLAQDFGINENELENIHPDDHDNYNNSNNIINTIQPRNVSDIIGMSMNNLNQEKYNRFANGPSPSGAPRYRPNRYKEGRGGGGDDDDQQRIRNAPTIEITEVKEEEEEEEEKEEEEDMVEMSDKLLKEKMDKIGICPQSYKWLPGRGTCMNCQQQFINGYRCAGGSHYVCKKCVNKA